MKTFHFLLLLVLIPCFLFAQYADYKVIHEQLSYELAFTDAMASADFNNDGFSDVVYSTSALGRIIYYKSNGDGSLANYKVIYSGVNYERIAAGDLNNDGLADLVLSSKPSNNTSGSVPKIAWLKNLGNDEFSNLIQISNNLTGNVSVEVEDVDGDNDNDILVVSGIDQKLSWIENLGNEAFSLPITIQSNVRYRGANMIDLDGDGDLDIIPEMRNGGQFGWLNNDGFENFNWTLIDGRVFQDSDLDIADLDNDLDNDIVVCADKIDNSLSRVIYFYNNDGNNNFILSDSLATNGLSKNIMLYDADENGTNDLVYIDEGKGVLRRNTGNGNWGVKESFNQGAKKLINSDINGDGHIDLLGFLANYNNGFWYEYQDIINGNGTTKQIIGNTEWQGELSKDFLLREQQGSNILNLDFSSIDAENSPENFNRLIYIGNGAFSNQENRFQTDFIGTGDLFDFDVNGDSFDDIVYAKSPSSFAWLEHDAMSNPVAEHIIQLDSLQINEVTIFDFGDIDGDNDADILVGIKDVNNEHSLIVFKNDGFGNFPTTLEIEINALKLENAKFGAVDQDVDLDVIVDNGVSIKWFQNDGIGNFGTPPTFLDLPERAGFENLYTVFQIADLDGDQHDEIFVRQTFWDGCFLHCGAETFMTVTSVYDNFNGFALSLLNENVPVDGVFADQNGDGNIDALIRGISPVYYWVMGDGLGGFTTGSTVIADNIFNTNDEIKIKAEDFDDDGDIDVFFLVNLITSSQIVLCENLEFTTTDYDNDGFLVNVDCDDNDSTILDYLVTPELIQNITICEEESIDIPVSNAHNRLNYLWSGPQNHSSYGPILQINDINSNQAGVYQVASYNDNCFSSVAQIEISIIDVEAAVITFESELLSVQGSFLSYQWFLNDVPISGATSQTYQPIEHGIYFVITSNSDECQSTSNEIQVSILGLTNNQINKGISIYPNPVSTQQFLNVKVNSTQRTTIFYEVISSDGKLVQKGDFRGSLSQISIPNLARGMYTLRMYSDKQSWISQFQIQ